MFGFQIEPKDERVLCRQAPSGSKNAARCESPHDMALSNCLTEVVFLSPKLHKIDGSTCKVRLFALGRGPRSQKSQKINSWRRTNSRRAAVSLADVAGDL